MSERECLIVRDLMPQCIENLCSDESREMVENHVARCPECAQTYSYMRASTTLKAEIAENMNFAAWLKKMRKSVIGRSVMYSMAGVVALLLLLFAGNAVYRYFYHTYNQPLLLTDYQVQLSKTSEGNLLMDWIFDGKPFVGHRKAEMIDGILYLSYDSSKARQREDYPYRTIRSPYYLKEGRLYEADADLDRPEVQGREVFEIRQGDQDNYKTLYKTGDTIRSCSAEKERQIKGGHADMLWSMSYQLTSFQPVYPIAPESLKPSTVNP